MTYLAKRKRNCLKKAMVGLLLSSTICAQAQVAPFKKGDRVVFTGNSITDGGHYHSYIWLYYMTRFPNERIDVFNAGIGGDVAEQMYQRLDDDVFSHKPTVVTLTFGMNDAGYYDFLKPKPQADSIAKERIKQSYNSYQKIEKRFQDQPNVKKIIIAGSPYDETVKKPNNYFPGKAKAMQEIVSFQQASAQKNNWGFVDFFHPMTDINSREQAKDSTFTLGGGDRIHPSNNGHMVMAYLFLKTQGFAGKDVADITVDAQKKTVSQQVNCKVSGLQTSSTNGIRFQYLANALPYPVDTVPRGWMETKSQADGLQLVPFTQEMNREMLTVKGLQASKLYELMIDTINVGSFTGAAFDSGINLATIDKTPEYKQAMEVMYLNEERWEIERKLRQYYWMEFSFFREKGLLFADNQAALDTLNANMQKNIFLGGSRDSYLRAMHPEVRDTWRQEMALLVDKIYTLNKPKEHIISIL